MDIRKLRHALALAEAGSFARAAESVHLSQPAFSRSIQSLEQDLGVALFVRGRRKVTPTPFGKVIVERARKMLWEASGMRRDVNMMKAQELGDVAFGFGPLPAAMLLVGILEKLVKDVPAIRTTVEIMHWQHLIILLESEKLDFFIADCRELVSSERLSISLMPRFPVKYYCRKGHPILNRRNLRGQDLLRYPLGSFKLPAASYATVTQFLHFEGDPEKLWTLQCDNLLVLERVASQTDMVILGPEYAFRAELRRKNIFEIKLSPALPLTTYFGVVTLRNRILSPAAELVIRLAQEELTEPST